MGDRLLYYLYGTPFIAGTSTLWLLLFVQIANVFMLLFTITLKAVNLPRETFRITVIASIVNVLLNILLIPFFGILGAAIATCCAMSLNAFLAYWILSKIIVLRFEVRPIRNICIAALAMGISVLLFRFFIPLSTIYLVFAAVCFGALIYILLVFRMDSGMYAEIMGIIQEIKSDKS